MDVGGQDSNGDPSTKAMIDSIALRRKWPFEVGARPQTDTDAASAVWATQETPQMAEETLNLHRSSQTLGQ